MSGHDQRTLQISKLEVDLANQQAKYETWLVENNDKIGQQAYEDYVEQFRIWQTDMMAKLNELRTSIKRQPVVNTPTLGKSLDEQVADAVKDVSLNDFMKVLMTLVKKDPSLLERLNQSIKRETQGTGQMIPTDFSIPPPAIIPQIPMYPPVTKAQIPPPTHYNINPSVKTTFMAVNQSSGVPVGPSAFKQPQYTQMTSYGAIPDTWVVDQPVRRQKNSPVPERQLLPNLPFKDFSQI